MMEIDQNKQRAAAELLAGVLGGMKHWPLEKQNKIWDWLRPFLDKILGSNVKSDTLLVWTSFLEYMFFSRDPRRVQPLVDHLFESFRTCDFNGELSLSAVKVTSFIRAFYEELSWRCTPWMDEILQRYWQELNSEHDEVRAYIADALEYAGKAKVLAVNKFSYRVFTDTSCLSSGHRNRQSQRQRSLSENVGRNLSILISWVSEARITRIG